MEFSRFSRQELIEGLDQRVISKSVVGYTSTDPLGKSTMTSSAAFGVGNMIVIDDAKVKRKEMLLDNPLREGKPRACELARVLEELFPDVNIYAYDFSPKIAPARGIFGDANVLIDTSNDPILKQCSALSANRNRQSALLASTSPGYFKAVYASPNRDITAEHALSEFANQAPDEVLSIPMGGFLVEEIRRALFRSNPLLLADEEDEHGRAIHEHEFELKEPAYVQFGYGDDPARLNQYLNCARKFAHSGAFRGLRRGLRALVIGAGGIGGFGAQTLAEMGFGELIIVDMDYFERTNLNRQIWGTGHLGEPKAERVAKGIEAYSHGRTRATAIVEEFNLEFKLDKPVDIIFDWVDNMPTRAMISVFAINNKIPEISAAVNPTSATWAAYVPGASKCMNDTFRYHSLGREEEFRRRQSCTQNEHEPSLVMTNQIAALSAIAAGTVFDPRVYGVLFNGVVRYSSYSAPRKISLTPSSSACDCHTRGVTLDWEVD